MQTGAIKFKNTNRGFTLLEVVIALAMLGLTVGMIFRVASTSIQLSNSVVDNQKTTMERNAFFHLLKNHFEQIPGNAVMRLESYEGSGSPRARQLFILTFQNVPMSFNWGETPLTAEAVQLATVEQRDGFVDVVLRFYDEPILEDNNSTGNENIEPVAQITLIEDMWECFCEVVDRRLDVDTQWDNRGQLPLLMKFYCRFDPTADIVQQTFWVVPKQDPEAVFRQIIQQNPAGPQGEIPGGGNDGSGGSVPGIDIQPGTVRPVGGGRPTQGRGGNGPPVPGGNNNGLPIPGQ